MGTVSIELALVWAYRDQMVHAALPQGMPVEASQGYSPGLSEGRFLADKIDAGVVTPFAAHADAYAIHSQVQRLRPVTVKRGRDELEMLYARRLLRNDFDSMDHRSGGDASRPAETVEVQPRSLVQEHAMRGSRPDACIEPSVIYEKGLRVYTDRHGRVVTHHTRFGFHLLKAVGDDPLEVIALRRSYVVWRQALLDLRIMLAGNLRSRKLSDEIPAAVSLAI